MTRCFLDAILELLEKVRRSAGLLASGPKGDGVRKSTSPKSGARRDFGTQTELRRPLRSRSAPPTFAAFGTKEKRRSSSSSGESSKRDGKGLSKSDRDGKGNRSSKRDRAGSSIQSPKSLARSSGKSSGKHPSKEEANRHRVRSSRVVNNWKQFESKNGPLSSRHPKGFYNYGADCYRNALLQVLLHQPAFCQYLVDIHRWCDVMPAANPLPDGRWQYCTVCTLQALNVFYWRGRHPAKYFRIARKDKSQMTFPPSMSAEITHALLFDCQRTRNAMWEDLAHGRQSDPFDLLTFMLDLFQEKEDQDRKDLALELSPTDTNYRPAETKGEDQEPPITATELFIPFLNRTWTCTDCGTTTTRILHSGEIGHGAGVAVDITQHHKGPALLDFLRKGYFSDAMGIQCQSAACLLAGQPKEKIREVTFTLLRAPEILVVRLNRFRMLPTKDGRVAFRKESRAQVAYGEFLDLAEFTEAPDRPLGYRLDGVICHRGETIELGHYAAAVRQVPPLAGDDRMMAQQAQTESKGTRKEKDEERVEEQKFCLIDDAKIRRYWGGTVRELLEPRDGNESANWKEAVVGNQWDPYILVYARVGG